MIYFGTSATLLAMVTAGSRAVIAESLQVLGCIAFFGILPAIGVWEDCHFGLCFLNPCLDSLRFRIDLFKEGLDFLSLRFEEAANVEGNPVEAYFNRYYEMITAPYYYNMWTDLLGNSGLGGATRAGNALVGGYGGAENSWSRPIIENGLPVGGLFIIWRMWITKDLLVICIRSIKQGNYLPIFLFGAAGPILLFGLLGQPTNLGFAAFGSGLCLAAAMARKKI